MTIKLKRGEKRKKALLLIRNAPEHFGAKIITYEAIKSIGFYPTWEYGEKYNDVSYIQGVARSLGYRTSVGGWAIYLRA